MPAQPPRRRSSRLRKQGVAAPDQAGSAEDPDAEASKDSTEEKAEATEGDEQDRASTRSEATIEAEDGGESDDPQSQEPPTGDREDPRRPGDGRGELDQREDLKRRLRKMRRKLRHARRRKSRTKTSSGLNLLVKQAKAIGTLLAQTIDPRLWERLPQPIRIAAYNKANYNVWKMIMKSLGYSFKYLIGQLREGDGKSAWRRLVTLHAEETAGAETHYLQKLLMTSYKGVSGTNDVGHVRMFAEQLQRTNQDYKLAAGKFVPASILRSRILTLPKGYDSVVEAIETKNGTRAEDGREPLDFHEMVTMITKFENRQRRREEELLGESTKPRATKINRYFSSRRRPQHRRKHPARAFVATAGAGGKGPCWRCGRMGHFASECKEDVMVDGKPIPPRGDQARGRAVANRVQQRRNKRFDKGRKKPQVGFLAVEQRMSGEAMVTDAPASADGEVMIIDTGASGHFCVEGTALSHAKRTHRVISSAGDQTLVGEAIGDLGKLAGTIAVKGLRTGLASVGKLADDSDAILIFTSNKAYAIPRSRFLAKLAGLVQKQWEIGQRDDSGLYMSTPQALSKILTKQNGFKEPRDNSVGAIAMAAEETQETTGSEGTALFALAAWQRKTDIKRHRKPRGAWSFLRHFDRRTIRDQDSSWRSSAVGTRGSHQSKFVTGGIVPRDRGSTWRSTNNKSDVHFIDLCCGLGGFTKAGILAGWTPIASVDFCGSVAKHFGWNYPHPFERVNLVKGSDRARLVSKYRRRKIDVVLFSPPCQPYSVAGKQTPGDPRTFVVDGGISVILGLMPHLVVIECVANFITCKANPVYKEVVCRRLTNAGYHIHVARTNAAQCGVPVRRDRVFIVATRYERSGELEQHLGKTSRKPQMALSEWFPDLKLVCHHPCHSTPAVFDARSSPHPTMRTSSLKPFNKKTYRMRRGDAGPVADAVELSLSQKLMLSGMGPGFHWPKPGWKCFGKCCNGTGRTRKGRGIDMLGRSAGNIVVPQQALEVLSYCEINRRKRHYRPVSREAFTAAHATVRDVALPTQAEDRGEDAPGVSAQPTQTATERAMNRTDRGKHMGTRPRSTTMKLVRLHQRMGHASKKQMKKMVAEGSVLGLSGITAEDVDRMPPCDTCAQSNLTKQPHAKHGKIADRRRATLINMVIHTDTMHRRIPSMKKDTLIQTFVDEATRYAWVEFFMSKTYKNFTEMLERAEARMRAQHRESAEYKALRSTSRGRPVLNYFSDHASEMVSAKQRGRLAKQHMTLTIVSPSAKASNGIAERANRTLLDIARRLLVGSELPIAFWAEAFEMACDIYNRTTHAANGGKSPYEAYYGHAPRDISRMRTFGCKCFVHEDKGRRQDKSKLNKTARACVYLGMSKDDNRSHRIFNPRTERFLTATSVVFREDVPGGRLVEDCPMVKARMRDIVWSRRSSRGNNERERAATSGRRNQQEEDTEVSRGSELGYASSVDSDSEADHVNDGWNQIYRAKNNETPREIAEAVGIDIETLLEMNTGIPGCDAATGHIQPDAKLRRGTGIWIPDNAEYRDRRSDAATNGAEDRPSDNEESEEDRDGPAVAPVDMAQPERSVRRSARLRAMVATPTASVDIDGLLHDIVECAKATAELIQGNRQGKALAAAIKPIMDLAEEKNRKAYGLTVAELSSIRGERESRTGKLMARDVPTPKSFKDALSGEFATEWNQAVIRELKNLKDHSVWEWCELPEGRTHTIDATWAWRVKPTSQGHVDKWKARLCARGFREVYGLDHVETHAPVTTLTAWRACLAEASKPGWHIHIWDVASAYLMSEIPEATPIYLRPFEGLEVPKIPHKRPLVLKLKKCLYGLKSSGRRWNQTIDRKLKSMGFRQSTNDPCLYIKENKEGIIRLNLHVDDCCATYNNEEMYQHFFDELKDEYKLSTAADNNMFLGMLIDRTKDGGIQVHQRHYLDTVLAVHNCDEWKPVVNPSRKISLSKEHAPKTDEERERMKNVPYRQIVGSLMYLANCTRPDISQALGVCARFSADPGEQHWAALKWILRYLVGTRDLCIRFGRKVPDMPFSPLHGNVDGSFGDDVDTRRSTTGYNFISYGGPIVWRSQRQKSVALSTCEAEYMAANEAGKEAIWLRRLYTEDFGYKDLSIVTYGDLSEREFEGAKPLTIFEDNTGCIALSRNPVQHKRSKHISIRYHWIRERVQSGELKLSKIDTKLNTADIFTKSTDNKTFVFLRDKLMAERETVPVKTVSTAARLDGGRIKVKEQVGDPSVESKDSESLLVPRPDGQHKGSNDMARRVGMTAVEEKGSQPSGALILHRVRHAYQASMHAARVLRERLNILITAWREESNCTYEGQWEDIAEASADIEACLANLQLAEHLTAVASQMQGVAADIAQARASAGNSSSAESPMEGVEQIPDIEDLVQGST